MNDDTKIEHYIIRLRARLVRLDPSEREDVVREIRAHIRDSMEESHLDAAEALARLGPPEELAAAYRDAALLRRAKTSFSPLLLLRAALRLATKGAFGIVVFFCAMFGYLLGGGMVLSGLLKCVLPAHTGAWFDGDKFVTSGTLFPIPPPPAHDVLGWWYVPIALTLGGLVLAGTILVIHKSLNASQRWQSKLAGAAPFGSSPAAHPPM